MIIASKARSPSANRRAQWRRRATSGLSGNVGGNTGRENRARLGRREPRYPEVSGRPRTMPGEALSRAATRRTLSDSPLAATRTGRASDDQVSSVAGDEPCSLACGLPRRTPAAVGRVSLRFPEEGENDVQVGSITITMRQTRRRDRVRLPDRRRCAPRHDGAREAPSPPLSTRRMRCRAPTSTRRSTRAAASGTG